MKKEYMSLLETSIAADNLSAIEARLGHEVPAGMLDVTELGSGYLTITEIDKIASNISAIEYQQEARKQLASNPTLAKITIFIYLIPVAVVAFCFIACMICEIFHL